MNRVKFNISAAIIKSTCAIVFLLAEVGCTHETRAITGTVVDEGGAGLSSATVTACYSGWGWSASQPVWDKDYCSEPVQTGPDGSYAISFKGPASMRLRARKDGWIQTRDFNTTHARIILVRVADNSARQVAENRRREQEFRQRRPEEADTAYYCRVILPAARPVNLNYHDESLAITPRLLESGDRSEVLFAVRGSTAAVTTFTAELRLKVDGQSDKAPASLKSIGADCETDIHFVALNLPGLPAGTDQRIEILVPGISALFEMQPWSRAATP